MSIPNLRALRDWCNKRFALTTDIENVAKSMIIGDTQYYLDNQHDKWGINTDPARGEKTFIPFPEDEGSSESGEGPSSITLKFDTNSARVPAVVTFSPIYYFPIQEINKIKKVTIKNVTLAVNRSNNSLPTSNYFAFNVFGTKKGKSLSENIYQFNTNSSTSTAKVASDIEIDLTNLDSIDYVNFGFSGSGTGYSINYYYTLKGSCEIEITLK